MHALFHLVEIYGAWVVGLMIALECVGIPLPGETVLVAAAVYAGTTHNLDIWIVVFAAAFGAIVGNLAGYLLGRELGYMLLLRYGPYVRLTETRLKIGQYLFKYHGSKVVLIARFVAGLRSVAGILAGANHMPWKPFLIANAVGGVVWAAVYGFGAYALGHRMHEVARPAAILIGVAVIVALIAVALFIKSHEAALAAAAEREFPGPLERPKRRRSKTKSKTKA